MSKQRSFLYAVLFTSVVAFLAGLLLVGTNALLKDRIETNILNERYRALFALAGVDVSNESGANIKKLYAERFSQKRLTGGRERLTYTSPKGETTHIYPLRGMGFWGPIHGFIALDGALTKIRGLVFTRQEETPGLGAEITTHRFLSQLKGKQITASAASTQIILAIKKAGEAKGANQIDGITGATETTMRVNSIIRGVLAGAVADRTRGGAHGN